MKDILNYIADKRGRNLKIGWVIAGVSVILINILGADDSVTIGELKHRSADVLIVVTYILYAGLHIKNSMRIMSSKMMSKGECRQAMKRRGHEG